MECPRLSISIAIFTEPCVRMPANFNGMSGSASGPGGAEGATDGAGRGATGAGGGGGDGLGLNRNRFRCTPSGLGRSAFNASRWTSGAVMNGAGAPDDDRLTFDTGRAAPVVVRGQ